MTTITSMKYPSTLILKKTNKYWQTSATAFVVKRGYNVHCTWHRTCDKHSTANLVNCTIYFWLIIKQPGIELHTLVQPWGEAGDNWHDKMTNKCHKVPFHHLHGRPHRGPLPLHSRHCLPINSDDNLQQANSRCLSLLAKDHTSESSKCNQQSMRCSSSHILH